VYNQRNFALGYHPWRAGDRLGYFDGRYSEVNYRSQNLKKPKRGDHWLRDDRGVFILASISMGGPACINGRVAVVSEIRLGPGALYTGRGH
jgi:Ni/Co efflux regulator RcnB